MSCQLKAVREAGDRLSRAAVRLATAILPVFLLAACGPGTIPSPAPEATPTATPTVPVGAVEVSDAAFTLAPGEGVPLVALLAFIADTPANRQSVLIDDYDTLRSLLGLDAPGPEAGREAVADHMRSLVLAGDDRQRDAGLSTLDNWLFGPHEHIGSSDTGPYTALDHRNAGLSAVAGEPPHHVEIGRGRFDPGATASALAACEECPDLDMAKHAGESFYSLGEDREQRLSLRFSPPMFDHLGRFGRLWVTDDVVVRTLTTDGMRETIDAAKGAAPSLAASPGFVLAARGLAGLGVHAAAISARDYSVDALAGELADEQQSTPEEIRQVIMTVPPLVGFTVAAAGPGFDADGSLFTAVALVHGDEAAAAENRDRLVERIKEGWIVRSVREDVVGRGFPEFSGEVWADVIERVEVSVDGQVLLARLYGRDGHIPAPALVPSYGFLGGRTIPDSLLAHE